MITNNLTRHQKHLQKAVDYIEKNLDHPISLKEVSKEAFSSLSYFHRIFYFLTGYTVKEYIRKRRLSHAADALHRTKHRVIDIALSTGYETPETFARAFQKEFGMNPSEFRRNNQEYSLFEKIDIHQKYEVSPFAKLDFKLNLEYVFYKKVLVRGFQLHTSLEKVQQGSIADFANTVLKNKMLEEHFDLHRSPLFGVYTNMGDKNEFDYTIGCLESACIKPSGKLQSYEIPSSRYAKFVLEDMRYIMQAWYYIYGYWFLENDEYRASGFDFEIYRGNSADIYIPA